MNHRERFFTAIELKEPDCVPITDLGFDPPIVNEILRREEAEQFGSPIKTDLPWRFETENRLAMIEAYSRLGFDAVPVVSDYIAVTKSYKPKQIGPLKYVDQWGRIMQVSREGKTTYFVGGTVNTPQDLEQYEPPNAFDPDVAEMIKRTMNRARTLDIAVMASCHSGWHMAFQVRGGIDKISIDFYRDPGFAKKLLERIAQACHAFAEAFIEGGAEILIVSDDYADNHGPLLNPRLFREYELSNLKAIVDIGKKHGVPVLKHSDGNLYPILEDIIATGISGLHPVEPGAMDLKDVKERFGSKICILGNVDCRNVLPYGSEAEVRMDVRRCIDSAAKGGGYILASSNSIHANVNVDNIYTMVDEARNYGRYLAR